MTDQVYIAGMGVCSALGNDVPALTEALLKGDSAISLMNENESNKNLEPALRLGAFIEGFSLSNELKKLSSLPQDILKNAELMLKRAPLSLQTSVISVLQAWLDAQLDTKPVSPERIAVVVACDTAFQNYNYQIYETFKRSPKFVSPRYVLQGMATDPMAAVSELLNIRGEGFSLHGASASGNVALVKAAQLLRLDEVDVCIVVGCMSELSPVALQGFFQAGALGGSSSWERPCKSCRPFDRDRDGFIYGQGSGCIVLENNSHRKKAMATVCGSSMCLDANRMADPNADGEARAMNQALSQARLSPHEIDYINAHGSASALGDSTEVEAIKIVFGESRKHCWINSSKSLLGHCLFSAGVIEVITTVIQMSTGFLHANLNLVNPIDDNCRFCPQDAIDICIETAVSNSFGFGGINTSIVIGKGDFRAI